MNKKISLEEFKQKVFEKLKTTYAPNRSDHEIMDAIEEYPEIIHDGYVNRYGQEYGVDYAANNIDLCSF